MKKTLLSILGACLIVVLLVGCSAKPENVALQLAEAVNAKDLEGALSLFADDAVVTSVSPEPFNGKAEIQGWLEEMFADNFHLEAGIVEVNENVVIGHDTMTMDSMSFYGIDELTGTSEITVEEGKIKTINFSFSDETLADLAHALGLEVILVVAIRLGCLNHALLTAESITSRGCVLAGWVANQMLPDATIASANIHALEQRIDCPRLGTIPWQEDISAKFVANHLLI